METAIFGLVGVVVGGLLNWFVSNRSQRQADKREALAVNRLIQRELLALALGLKEWIAEESTTEPPRESTLRFPAWERYHLVAARSLRTSVWTAISDSYLAVYPVRTSARFDGPIGGEELRHLRSALESVGQALRLLESADRRSRIRRWIPVSLTPPRGAE